MVLGRLFWANHLCLLLHDRGGSLRICIQAGRKMDDKRSSQVFSSFKELPAQLVEKAPTRQGAASKTSKSFVVGAAKEVGKRLASASDDVSGQKVHPLVQENMELRRKIRDLSELNASLQEDLGPRIAAVALKEEQANLDLFAAQRLLDDAKQDAASERAAATEFTAAEERRLRTKQLELEQMEAAMSLKVAKVERTTKRKEEKCRELEEQVLTLQSRIENQDGLLKDLRKAHKASRAELAVAQALSGKLDRDLKKEKSKASVERGRLFAHLPLVQNWMLELSEGGAGIDWTEEVATMGADPIQKSFLDCILRNHDHRPACCGSSNAGVLIVGRSGWKEEDLISQIAAREGMGLKIYSQEMALVAILAGVDPFEESEDVLRAFGDGHPALEYLMQLGFDWPTLAWEYEETLDVNWQDWRDKSPLTAMKYHVGITSGTTKRQRRDRLKLIFHGSLVFPESFSKEDKQEWGTPRSPHRLKRVAHHLVMNIRRNRNRANLETAVEHWAEDCDWLKESFYTPKMKFRWPSVKV